MIAFDIATILEKKTLRGTKLGKKKLGKQVWDTNSIEGFLQPFPLWKLREWLKEMHTLSASVWDRKYK